MIVVDASVFIKLFKIEDDSDIARRVIDALIDGDRPWLAPSVVLYETLAGALHIGQPFAKVSGLFDRLRLFGLAIEEPSLSDLNLAERIATARAPSGGHPTLFDSIYHAMAIELGGTFLTADRKHLEKTKSLGSVQLLSDWKPV
jgi:predicted nucleic acid-binding protein